jgi:hypothetical protein
MTNRKRGLFLVNFRIFSISIKMHRYKRYAELEHASHRVPVPTHTKAAHASSHHRHFNDVTSVAKHDDVSKHADKRTFVAPHPDAPLRHLPNHSDTPVPRRIDPPQQIHILFKADLEFKNYYEQYCYFKNKYEGYLIIFQINHLSKFCVYLTHVYAKQFQFFQLFCDNYTYNSFLHLPNCIIFHFCVLIVF